MAVSYILNNIICVFICKKIKNVVQYKIKGDWTVINLIEK